MPKHKKGLPYRPCVGVMLLNAKSEVWTGRRLDAANEEGRGEWWQMPQGGIDKGEDPAAAALRELYEETSVRSAKIIAEAPEWYTYDLPAELIGKAWKGKYRGQTQKWFALALHRERGRDQSEAAGPQAGIRCLALGADERSGQPHRRLQTAGLRESRRGFPPSWEAVMLHCKKKSFDIGGKYPHITPVWPEKGAA